MKNFIQDIRYGIRILTKHSGFTTAAVLTLALGIGANTAIFSLVDGVLLKPLPFEDPDRLVAVWEASTEDGGLMSVAPPNFQDWRDQNTVFEDVVAFYRDDFTLTGAGDPEQVEGAHVSAGTFQMLGVQPVLGRGLLPGEDRTGGPLAVVLGHNLWQRRFGGSTEILGSAIRVDGANYTVVGVMPQGFSYPPPIAREGVAPPVRAELWAPLEISPGQGRGAHFMRAIARLKPGISVDQADAEMTALAGGMAELYPNTNQFWGVAIVPLASQITGDIRSALLLLLAAVGFVLLIACTNVANLILAREMSRQKEIATRAALGAGRIRLARQLITENLLLSLFGGLIGFGFAYWAISFLISISPENIPRLAEVAVDIRMVGVTLVISAVTGLFFGLVPAVRMSNPDLFHWLRGREESASSHGLQNALVVGEVALSLILLVGAGLLFQSFLNLRTIDPGFSSEDTLTFRLSLPASRYGERYQRVGFGQELAERLDALQAVRSAGFADSIPLADDRQGTDFHVEGAPPAPLGREPIVNFTFVSSGYFPAMGMRLQQGRDFTSQDSDESALVAIIDQSLAQRFFPNENPVGKRIYLGFAAPGTYREVVGVVADVQHEELGGEASMNAYVPILQVNWPLPFVFALRTSTPGSLVNEVREIVRSMDSELPIYDGETLEEIVSDSVARPRFSAVLLGSFAGGALLLAAIGIYGVISFSVRQRVREIGIRIAMGALPGDILKLVVFRGMGLVFVGIGIGLAGALGLTRFLSSQLFGVGSADPATFGAITLLLSLTAFLACYVPARRATRVDPVEALHAE